MSYTENRDESLMAHRRMVAEKINELCTTHGASCEIRDMSIFRYPDGTLPDRKDEIWVHITAAGADALIVLDTKHRDPNSFFGSWRIDSPTAEMRFTSLFRRRASAVQHDKDKFKAIFICDGEMNLYACVADALDCLLEGKAIGVSG